MQSHAATDEKPSPELLFDTGSDVHIKNDLADLDSTTKEGHPQPIGLVNWYPWWSRPPERVGTGKIKLVKPGSKGDEFATSLLDNMVFILCNSTLERSTRRQLTATSTLSF